MPHIDDHLTHLDSLIRRGRQLEEMLAADSPDGGALAATRAWQQECAGTINQLSGGSKAHWLARAYSDAFLMRSTEGRAVEAATPAEITARIVGVLGQAVASLSQTDVRPTSTSSEPPRPRRFGFVHTPELRPIVEQAYDDSRRALEQGEYTLALFTSCGILEAIVTDALEHLEHRGLDALAAVDAPAGPIADWPFEARLAVAERAGLIHGGCARLPPVARKYREPTDANDEPVQRVTISERDARVASQVLHVLMRDLDPGR